MISPKWAQRIGRAHKWLGLVVGLQLLAWTASGFYFTWHPISQIRGDHLRRDINHGELVASRAQVTAEDALAEAWTEAPLSMSLQPFLGEMVWRIEAKGWSELVSAETGERLTPLEPSQIRTIAAQSWGGAGEMVSLDRLVEAPREYGGPIPVWAARFDAPGDPVFYIDGKTGELRAVRTDEWRMFDFLWMLHVMDYEERENFNHPLVFAASFLAVSMTLFGLMLVLHRFTRRRAVGRPLD